jgi:hypothetical protein
MTGEWRKLHNVELNDLYSSPNNVRVVKSRKKIYKMGCLEGSGVPVLYIGRTVPKG